MEAADLSLYTTVHKSGAKKLYRAYACVYFSAILGLIYYRIVNLPKEGRLPWLMVFGAELCFAFFWILEQAAFRWWPIERETFPEKLCQRFEKNLPDIDIFICTADPVKEPAVSVVNTVLSAMAFDYPVEKLACYLSDDGGSPLTFYALLEASSFAKSWLPFCNKYFIEQRCPEKFFLENIRNAHNVPISEFKKLKKLYEEMKDRINRTVEMGAVPDVIQKKHNGFKEWTSTIFTSRNHPSVVQIVLENGKDLDDEGGNLPSLIYVSREKRPGHPHHYKAGALNVLIRISAVMSNAPFILTLDCDMYANNTQALRQAMCFFLDPISGHQFAYVQFPQTFHGITKNDLYANDLKRIYQVHNKGMDGVGGPIYAGTGCIHRRDVLCGRDSSELIRMNIEATEKTSPPNMLKVVSFANCTWEENTEWGKKMEICLL